MTACETITFEQFCGQFNIEIKDFAPRDRAGPFQQWAQRQYKRFADHCISERKEKFYLQSNHPPKFKDEHFIIWCDRIERKLGLKGRGRK